MVEAASRARESINVRVELFGSARIISGRREVEIAVGGGSSSAELVEALGEACPELVGQVIAEDGRRLQESYVFNLNGITFVGDDPVRLTSGDTVLLFSSQSGG